MYLSKVPDVFVQIANRICPIKRVASGRGPGNFSQHYRELKAGQPSCNIWSWFRWGSIFAFCIFFKNFQLIVLEAMHNRLTLLLVKWHFICIVPIIQGLNIHHTVHYTFGGQTRTLNPVTTTVFMSPLPLLWDSHNFALDIASAFYLLTHFVFFEHLTYWLLTNMLASGFLFDQIKSKVVSRLVGNWGGKSFLFLRKYKTQKIS